MLKKGRPFPGIEPSAGHNMVLGVNFSPVHCELSQSFSNALEGFSYSAGCCLCTTQGTHGELEIMMLAVIKSTSHGSNDRELKLP